MGQEHSQEPCELAAASSHEAGGGGSGRVAGRHHQHHHHHQQHYDRHGGGGYSSSTNNSTKSSSTKDSRISRASSHSYVCKDPEPGLTRCSKGSLTSSGCGSTVTRSSSNASADSRGSHRPIYTNVHYRDVNNNDIYKPLKIGKNKIHRLKLLDADKDTAEYLEKHLSIKSYLDKEEAKKASECPHIQEQATKKSGIRNYTPKILSEKNMQKDLEHWI